MSVESMAKLSNLEYIVGVKDATAQLDRPILTTLACGKEFCQLSGEDATAVPYLAAGGHGCISVTGNILPRMCSKMQNAWLSGDVTEAMKLQEFLMPVHAAMFCETSPGPVKYAAELLGLCTSETRLPITDISDTSKSTVKEALTVVGSL